MAAFFHGIVGAGARSSKWANGLVLRGAARWAFQGDIKTGQNWPRFSPMRCSGDRIGSARVPGRGAFPRLQGESESMPRSAVMGQQNGTMQALCLQESDFRPETYPLWDS
jgi:hypothetical protein